MDLTLFEQGTRLNLRFEGSGRGELTISDLWTLPVKSEKTNELTLVKLAKPIAKTIREESDDFLGEIPTTEFRTLELKLAIIKRIIEVKNSEAEARKAKLALEQMREEDREILLAAKSDIRRKELSSLSSDEIDARLAKLG